MAKRVVDLDATQTGLVKLAYANYQSELAKAQQTLGAQLATIIMPVRTAVGCPDGAIMEIVNGTQEGSLAAAWEQPDLPIPKGPINRGKGKR